MSSIASFTARRALVARPALLSRAAPIRRFASSKAEESNLPKAGKRDPELYVCSLIRWKRSIGIFEADYVYRFFSVSCPVLSCLLDGNSPRPYFHSSYDASNCKTTHLIENTDKKSERWLTKHDRFFGRKPTSVTSESNVRIGESAMPWEGDNEGKVFKYQYHPHGDKSQPLRNAPSALNTVIVPNVTLPEVRPIPYLPDTILDGLGLLRRLCVGRISMRSSTSTERRNMTTKYSLSFHARTMMRSLIGV